MKNKNSFITVIILLITVISSTSSFSQLNGSYTIGTGGNFPTIASAVAELNLNGVSGPVTLSILPGTYFEKAVIGNVQGTSIANTITFRASDSGTVIWKPTDDDLNYIFKIEGTKNLIIQNVIFESLVTPSGFVPDLIAIEPGSQNISFIKNVFNISEDFGQTKVGLKALNSNIPNLLITGNLFNSTGPIGPNNKYGIYVSGLSPALIIRNNEFNSYGAISMRIDNTNSTLIEMNSILQAGSTGLISNNCTDLKIVKNKFSVTSADLFTSGLCMTINGCTGSGSLIANNFFACYDSHGVFITNSSDVKIYYNSFAGYTWWVKSISISNCQSLNFRNNLIENLTGNFRPGYPYIKSNSGVSSDYNDYYYNCFYIAQIDGANISSLAGLIAATGNDSNSKTEPIEFVSATDLHLTGQSAGNTNLTGIPVPEVTDDIDGQPRNPVSPYKGADEPQRVSVDLKLFIEGFYNDVLNTQVSDTITGFLRSSTSPYNIADSAKAIVNSNGNAALNFFNIVPGNYYITVKHRNSVETWSSSAVQIAATGNIYDFTSSESKAYGNNLVLKGTKYCLYSGDVNQDGTIDATDILLIYNDIIIFKTGYISTDVNGDGVADTADILICYNNSNKFVHLIRP